MATEGMRSILAATDLGPASDGVVAGAAALAERVGAELHLVHALEIENLPELDHPTFPGRVRQAEELLAEQVRRAGVRGGPASAQVAITAAARAVEERAAAVRAEMVVLGPHRGGEAGARILGTTAQGVIGAARVPALVVRGSLAFPLARMGAPTDFSERSRHALDLALRLAARLLGDEGGVVVFHAAWAVEHEDPAARHALESSLREELEAAARRGGGGSVPVRAELAWGISPADTVARFAEEQGMELLVMGTHGRTGLSRMMAGSVASGVARHARCSVLLVPGEAR